MKSKLTKLLMLLVLAGFVKVYGQGFSSQFVPGLQFGSTKIKRTDVSYKFGASLAIMELDALKNKWYFNINCSDFYYKATTLNRLEKMKRDSAKYAKNNGQMIGMRLGYAFGKGEFQRVGFFLGGSWDGTNAAKSYDPWKGPIQYGAFGGGLMFYRKIGKNINVLIKGGYESLKGKKDAVKGRLILFETSIGYELFQRFGVSVQPAFYSRKFDFTESGTTTAFTGTKANQFVFKVGIGKFFR